MTKNYIIEGGIDFYAELYSSLDNKNIENQIDETDKNVCLITDDPLEAKSVTLTCNHKFNYVPLYKDLVNHKRKFNTMESTGALKHGEIRCPYCRHKQQFILPYYAELGLPKVSGVNEVYKYEPPTPYPYYNNIKKCDFVETFPFLQDVSAADNLVTLSCKKYGYKFAGFEDGDEHSEKYYCCEHKRFITKQHKQDVRDKLKAAKEAEKKLKKEEAIKAKEEAMEQKKLLKAESKSNDKSKSNVKVSENVYSDENTIVCVGCQQYLVSGPRKGLQCNLNVFQDDRCKRHYDKKTS
uniref:Uncharacterized protein n=1 Tax=viral metagenome TaxID=1070528 RepID=A0A6C0E6V9_9ZZZZ